LLLLLITLGWADLRIAVASNFAPALRDLARAFESQSGHRIHLAPGSTGKHFAQIANGAPFDLFFAADSERPSRLEQIEIAVKGTRRTYAMGSLVLWSTRGSDGFRQLKSGDFRYLAIANPRLAPYGRAAKEVLVELGLWEPYRDRIVQGENVAQAYQFVHSGNAQIGFVAQSQLRRSDAAAPVGFWKVPQELYAPILQQVVMLVDSPAAREFLEFIGSERGRIIIREHGYDVP